METSVFVRELLRWYAENKRELPWRNTDNPYYIWLSEIILQQTRVKQGLPYYEKFVEQYPTLEDLANASEEEVLRIWQGLGYYSRGRNLLYTAQEIVRERGGKFPADYQALLQLKGVGKYTAAAIASFAYGERVAVVDGNVYRVLARFFGIESDIASAEGMHTFATLAQEIIPAECPGVYNQAVMEFGALQCTPQKPNCLFCPIRDDCRAYHQGKQALLPIKNQKIKVRERFFHYLLLRYQGRVLMKKRSTDDIWAGLYDFPLVEYTNALNWEQVLEEGGLESYSRLLRLEYESSIHRHILSHQRIQAKFYIIQVVDPGFEVQWLEKQQFVFYGWEDVQRLPKPVLIDKFLKKKFFS